ncbi:putative electron transport protein YkgF [Dissostichus eleginoides]|uniref:Electron transport protein YkgF n=1 Tax=Dissostichus eleginoides TaxID=100907 RepID=A0AAD9C867_DISEL|nr:putative electron transport protein YkgF [Dissostichus eleginoides]
MEKAVCTVPGFNPTSEECGGKFREDSGVGALDFRLPAGQLQLICPLRAPLDPLRLPLADREAPTSLTDKREKVVWLLFLQMMSHPDFAFWALSACVGTKAASPTEGQPSVKGPEKTTPPLKPHIGPKERNDPTNISGCLAVDVALFL